jgi:hypothetical protein
MSTQSFVKAVGVAVVATAICPAVQNAAIDEINPACGMQTAATPPIDMACREKQPTQQHDERDTTPATYQQTVGVTVTPTVAYIEATGVSGSAGVAHLTAAP